MQELKAAEILQHQLLQKYDQYHYTYMTLKAMCIRYSYEDGLIGYGEVIQWKIDWLNR